MALKPAQKVKQGRRRRRRHKKLQGQEEGLQDKDAMAFDAVPPELRIDEKREAAHRLDSLSLLLYCVLLSATVLTIWMFKHRRVRYLHETGLAIVYGLVIGALREKNKHLCQGSGVSSCSV